MFLEEDDQPRWYIKHYTCECGCSWQDEWNCLCNDKCPECNAEIEPDTWEEVDGLTPEEIRRLVS